MMRRILVVVVLVGIFFGLFWVLRDGGPRGSAGHWLSWAEASPPEPPAVVPEPGTLALVALGVAGIAAAARRKRGRGR